MICPQHAMQCLTNTSHYHTCDHVVPLKVTWNRFSSHLDNAYPFLKLKYLFLCESILISSGNVNASFFCISLELSTQSQL